MPAFRLASERAEMRGLAVQADAALAGPEAGDAFHEFRAAGADETGETEYFAAVEREARVARVAGDREVGHFEHGLGMGAAAPVRVKLGHVAADHEAGHVHRLQLRGGVGGDEAAVAQHADAVGDGLHLRQAVGDVENTNAAGTDVGDDAQQRFRLERGERGGGLVEDHHAVRRKQHAADLDELALGDRQAADDGVRVDPGAKLVEGLAGAGAHGAVVHHQAAAQLAPEVEVLRHGQVGGEQDFLVDEGDAALLRLRRTAQSDERTPSIRIPPAVGWRWPAKTFISVDLPAPFSPITAWTSPAFTSSVRPCSTVTGPKALVMPTA